MAEDLGDLRERDPGAGHLASQRYLYRLFAPRRDGIRALPHRASEVSVTPWGTYDKAGTRVFLSSLLLLTLRGSRASVPETGIYQALCDFRYR